MTSSGIELTTFRFIAQHLNHRATAVPYIYIYIYIYTYNFSNVYIIITATCFDTVVSASGSSKVVLRQTYVFSIL